MEPRDIPKLGPQIHAFIQDTRRYKGLAKVLVNQSNNLPIQINDGPSIVMTQIVVSSFIRIVIAVSLMGRKNILMEQVHVVMPVKTSWITIFHHTVGYT